MLIINFKGNTPQSRFNYIGVKGDNASNKVGFLIQKVQEEIDLSQFNAYLKVQSKEHEYIDKILLTETSDTDFVYLTWEITRKSTHYRNLELQIVFEGTNEDIVWQTMMFEAELSDTIKVDETLPEEELSVLEQYGKIVMSFEARLEALEQNALRKSDIVDDLESSDSEKVLSAKQGKVLNDKINIAISGTYKPRGSKTVAQLNAIDTSTLENGFVFNMLDSGILTIGNVKVMEGDNVAWIIENNVGYWDKLAGMVDLSDYPTKSGDETITGGWNFNNGFTIGTTRLATFACAPQEGMVIRDNNTGAGITAGYISGVGASVRPYANNTSIGDSTKAWKDLYLNGTAYCGSYVLDSTADTSISVNQYGNIKLRANANDVAYVISSGIQPASNNAKDLGSSSVAWKDLYLSGKIQFTTNSYISIDQYDRIYFTNQNNPKFVIDGAQCYINNNLLPLTPNSRNIGSTQNQFVNGYFSGQVYAQNTFNVINASDITSNTLTQSQFDLINNGKPTIINGTWLTFERTIILNCTQVTSTLYQCVLLTMVGGSSVLRIATISNLVVSIGGYRYLKLNDLGQVNGKDIPVFPSNTGDYALKQINGTLTWAQEWYGTQAQYDALGTYDSNTIYNIIEE